MWHAVFFFWVFFFHGNLGRKNLADVMATNICRFFSDSLQMESICPPPQIVVYSAEQSQHRQFYKQHWISFNSL